MMLFVLFLILFSQTWSLKTVIITGANRGIGFEAAKSLASTNEWEVILACRDEARGLSALQQITQGRENCKLMTLDLADLNSVKNFVKKLGNKSIDALALNAGIQTSTSGLGGKEKELKPKLTAQGHELTVGTNHIGHFLLMKLLMPNINNDNGRIVYVGSGVHNPDEGGGNVGSKATLGNLKGFQEGFVYPITMIDGGDFDPDKAYKDSKLCNVMTTIELARRLKNNKSKITANVMNPGLIPTTGLFRDINPIFVFFFTILTKYIFKVTSSEAEGGRRIAYLVANPTINGLSGGYYTGKAGTTEFFPSVPSVEARDEAKASLLWSLTEKIVEKYL